jgi:hypothetical protein
VIMLLVVRRSLTLKGNEGFHQQSLDSRRWRRLGSNLPSEIGPRPFPHNILYLGWVMAGTLTLIATRQGENAENRQTQEYSSPSPFGVGFNFMGRKRNVPKLVLGLGQIGFG